MKNYLIYKENILDCRKISMSLCKRLGRNVWLRKEWNKTIKNKMIKTMKIYQLKNKPKMN